MIFSVLLRLASIVAAATMLASCASKSDMELVKGEIAALKGEMDKTKAAVATYAQELKQLQASVAALKADLMDARDSIAAAQERPQNKMTGARPKAKKRRR
jgi:chromosome segregation ATPase